KTVGIQGIAPACTNLANRQVPSGTTVIYCYTITNTGNVPLTNHNLVDSHLGPIAVESGFVLEPGASFSRTITQTLSVGVTNMATWTASVDEGAIAARYQMATPLAIFQEGVVVATTSQAT